MVGRTALIATLIALIAGVVIVPWQSATPPNDYYLNRVKWFADHPAKGRIVLLGDSITARGKWEKAFPGCGIVNRAIEYETTTGALARLDEVERVGAPVSVVMLGANDISQLEPVPGILDRYRRIVRRLGLRSHVIVVSTTLRAADQAAANSEITRLNQALKGDCAKGACRFVDLNAEIAPEGYVGPEYLSDQVHLSQAAYQRWHGIMRSVLDCPAG